MQETEVMYKRGNSYPDGGDAEEIEYDICQECFENKLMPFLKKEGAKNEFREYDW